MKKVLKMSLFLMLSLQVNNVVASCTNLLRLEINKRLGKKSFLFSPKFSELVQSRNLDLEREFMYYPEAKEMLASKRIKSSLKLKEMLYASSLEHNKVEVLKSYNKNLHDKSFLSKWVQDLYIDVIVEMYSKRDVLDIRRFESSGFLDQNYIISTILERSKEGNFDGDLSSIKFLEDELDSDSFKRSLLEKKYIYDKSFEFKNHGHLIHIFHIDLMINSLKYSLLDPSLSSEIYTWFGRNNIYFDNNGLPFKPIEAWSALFDSFEKDFTSPEVLNSLLREYFKYARYQEEKFD